VAWLFGSEAGGRGLRAERQPFIPDFGRSTEMKMPQLCACGKQFSIVVVISEINFGTMLLFVFHDVAAGSTTRRISPPV
jgi:hypothetical protein